MGWHRTTPWQAAPTLTPTAAQRAPGPAHRERGFSAQQGPKGGSAAIFSANVSPCQGATAERGVGGCGSGTGATAVL
jgi:hypothetical protein